MEWIDSSLDRLRDFVETYLAWMVPSLMIVFVRFCFDWFQKVNDLNEFSAIEVCLFVGVRIDFVLMRLSVCVCRAVARTDQRMLATSRTGSAGKPRNTSDTNPIPLTHSAD